MYTSSVKPFLCKLAFEILHFCNKGEVFLWVASSHGYLLVFVEEARREEEIRIKLSEPREEIK